ncbi:hypothetical protein ACLKA6_003245 [Drosophila palustris]
MSQQQQQKGDSSKRPARRLPFHPHRRSSRKLPRLELDAAMTDDVLELSTSPILDPAVEAGLTPPPTGSPGSAGTVFRWPEVQQQQPEEQQQQPQKQRPKQQKQRPKRQKPTLSLPTQPTTLPTAQPAARPLVQLPAQQQPAAARPLARPAALPTAQPAALPMVQLPAQQQPAAARPLARPAALPTAQPAALPMVQLPAQQQPAAARPLARPAALPTAQPAALPMVQLPASTSGPTQGAASSGTVAHTAVDADHHRGHGLGRGAGGAVTL